MLAPVPWSFRRRPVPDPLADARRGVRSGA